jgi:UDP-N-acetylglucosamine:LPS N-acetylglucosamine transferase
LINPCAAARAHPSGRAYAAPVAADGSERVDQRAGPARVLVLSVRVGEGHVAAAWRDRLLARSWAMTMHRAPWLYGLGYALLVRAPPIARWCKGIAAARLGRSLAALLAAERPDLVLSTYPMTSGGLAWLRRHDRLPARSVAVVTDVAVHPFWVWADIDETWTLLPASCAQARAALPTAQVRVAPPAVDPRFRPGDRAAARAACGLPTMAFVVLVTGGSHAFGGLERVVDAVLAAGERVQAVVLCGHAERLHRRLTRRGLPAARLVALSWTEDVPRLVAAADVVLTTAGGMIATEALAAGRPVLFAAPVPGHGRAGARMTADAGLGVVCPRTNDVTAVVRRLRDRADELAALAARAEAFGRADLDAALTALAARI